MTDAFKAQPFAARCPSDEVLGLYGVGELPPCHPAAVHISACPMCRRRLRQLEEGLVLWRERILAECAGIAIEQIKLNVHRKLREEQVC